ncbi:MAG: 16S rRNA (guanine(527)-N(7))-methyltransferase RsmG [Bacteroidia bacterium]|nr:16S rRNA (guanine(527)-N(7))-methyltransferase RsmG [Bacteroidia bacterium]MCZ2277727.1 16S rRNA (guanine(527)-N(7))-methyltransferase RsmG [Bacteroidia bacterium]
MKDAGIVFSYFPTLTVLQKQQLEQLGRVFPEINKRVNLISRNDIENLYEHHVLHSLAIARKLCFRDGSQVVDIGTGGGFPGIPLAVLFPQVNFYLIDSVAKKIRAVDKIATELHLKNVITLNNRIELTTERFDIAVSRAVASLKDLKNWMKGKFKNERQAAIVCLKGGDLSREMKEVGGRIEVTPISEFFKEEFFSEKYIVIWRY